MGEEERRFLNAFRTVFCRAETKILQHGKKINISNISSIHEGPTSEIH